MVASCRSTTLLYWGQKPSSNPLQVWGGHAHQRGSSPGYLIAAGSALTWSVPSDLPCCTLTQEHPADSGAQRGPSPHSSEMQSTQQGCAQGWPGRRGFLLQALQAWRGAVAGTVPAGSAGASTGSFCSVSDALSVLWDEHFVQSKKELWGQSHSPPNISGSGQSSRSAL